MKIKLAILEKDKIYLQKFVSFFSDKYSDKFEIYSFTDLGIATETVKNAKIDVFLAGDSFEIDPSTIPGRCGTAYFVDSSDIATYNGKPAICRFQKAELICKQIISVYSDNAGNISGIQKSVEGSRIVVFSSPCGGTGTSTMAAAMAVHYARLGKKTIYINFERFGSSDVFFSGEGQFNMTDIIYALKGKNVNIALKLESCVKQDACGVYFLSQSEVALHMIEFKAEEKMALIDAIKNSGVYDYIIVDMDFNSDKASLNIMNKGHAVVIVCDGSEMANVKVLRAYNTIAKIKDEELADICDKMCIIYNKFSSKVNKTIENVGIRSIGGAPKYERATTEVIVTELSKNSMFDGIVG